MLAVSPNEAQAELARRELQRRGATTGIEAFCSRMDPEYRSAPHTQLLCKHLDALERREINKLAIFMPPRCGKTYHAAERFPSYFAGRNPKLEQITASFALDRAARSSRRARDLVMERAWPFESVSLDAKSTAVGEWFTNQGGVVKAVGVGGPIMGLNADLLVIDDPVKGRQEADSELQRRRDWEWYTESAARRLNRGGLQLLMMTRWHEDDIAGRILGSPSASEWVVLSLPWYAEENDVLGRAVGEELWPDGIPPVPDPAKGEISTRGFSALYQQHPEPDDGIMFKREWMQRFYPWGNPPACTRTVISIDGAWKEGVQNDRSGAALWGHDGVDYYLLDAWAARLEYPELKAKVIEYYTRHRPESLLVEDAASGTALVQELKRSTGIPVVGIVAKGAKEARAEAITPVFESGKVVLPHGAPFLDEWVSEHLKFPAGKHDDWVDTTSIALTRLASSSGLNWGKLRV